MAKTVIYLVRHGQSIGNLHRTLLGHTDLDLSELGFKQAAACAEALKDVKFDAIYSSDLKRAMSTAAPHAKMRGMEVFPAIDLREIYLGDWENRTVDDIRASYGDMYDVDWTHHFFTFICPNGESVPHLAARIRTKITYIANDYPGKTLLFTLHAAAIRSFWATVRQFKTGDLTTELPFPSNASYSIVEYENGIFTPISYSVDSHITDNMHF